MALAVAPQHQLVQHRSGQLKTNSSGVQTGHSQLFAPNVVLTGHRAPVYSCRFNPNGRTLASAGHCKDIFLWDYEGQCQNKCLLKGHKNAVLQVCWHRGGDMLLSASTDETAAVWDCNVGARIKQIKEHKSFVNAIAVSRRGTPIIVTGADDGSAKLFDLRQRASLVTFDCTYQCTAVALSDDAMTVYTGGIDNDIKIWDIRTRKQRGVFTGHDDTITHLSLSPDGYSLLSNAMDMRIHCWDIRPKAINPNTRLMKTFEGATHSEEQNLLRCNWSSDGRYVCAGSSNRMVYVWDFNTRQVAYRLPGHTGSVNEVDFHPTDRVLLSCSSDRTMYIGELHG